MGAYVILLDKEVYNRTKDFFMTVIRKSLGRCPCKMFAVYNKTIKL